jgi:hypothetical protein
MLMTKDDTKLTSIVIIVHTIVTRRWGEGGW